jgi:hypothetical protein
LGTNDLAAEALRALLDEAAAAGVAEQTLQRASVAVIELQAQNIELTRMADPRKVRTAELQARVVEAHAAMLKVGAENPAAILAERFGRSRKRIWSLLHTARHSRLGTSKSAFPALRHRRSSS